MKISKKLYFSALCCTIAVISVTAAGVKDISATPLSEVRSADAVYAEHLLDDPLSPGIRVIAYDRPMIISGTGDKIGFSAEVFDDYNGYVPSTVKIISLPDSNSGTLLYNSEPVTTGQSVSVLSLSSLCYEPKSNDDAEFTFSPDNASIMRCVIRQTDSQNTSPTVTDYSTVTTYTKLDTAVAGYLGGTDPDGDSVTYEIVSRPTKGIVSVTDEQTGQFVYHPYNGMSGSDTFTYRICDSYGSYSDIGTMNLSIDNRSANIYDDTADSYYASAIDDVVSADVMQTRKTADGEYFDPDEPVSRIDFLIMAMKAMGAGEAESVSSTPFSDDDTLTDSEKGYLSAAYRLGIINGSTSGGKLTFMPDEAVTGASAAVMLNGILGLPEDDALLASALNESIPAWAAPAVSALTNVGIINKHTAPADSCLTRENTAVILSQLMREIA